MMRAKPGAGRLTGGQVPYVPTPPPGALTGLTCGLAGPVGVDDPAPRLSWRARLAQPTPVTVSAAGLPVWSALAPAGAIAIDVPGDVLEPVTSYRWRVGELVSGSFTTGLRVDGTWDVPWIGGEAEAAVSLRGRFTWDSGREVWLATTALGLYRALLNGRRLGDEELAPGWTDYAHRVRYRLVELTGLLQLGENLLELWLAPGWYAGHVAAGGTRRYGERPAASAQVLSGATRIAATGPGWTVHDLGRPRADLVMGETVRTPAGRSKPAVVVAAPGIPVEADPAPPVRATGSVPAATVMEPVPGVQVADFGRNLVGRLRLRISAPEPAHVVVRHGEELAPDGRLYTANLRTAEQRDEFLLEPGEHTVETAFTLHGFRYAEITGWPGALSPDDVVAVTLGSDLPVTGSLSAGDPAVERLVANITASAEGNLVSVPTDCPQRDERAGWTADISVFGSTLTFLKDAQAFLSGWVTTLIDGQRDDGAVPHVAPVLAEYGYDSPVWSDAIVEVPWLLWRRYGDDRTLRRAYDPMRRWMDYCLAQSEDGVRPGRALGDWLAPGSVETPKSLIATAALARSLRLVAHTADVLDEPHAAEYTAAADIVVGAFQRTFLAGARLHTPTQTGYALVLAWDLVAPEHRTSTAAALAELVRSDRLRLTTGFVGTPLLLPVLSETGHHDLACAIFNQEGYPSWRYQVRAGATTMWERWDAWHHRNGPQTPAMNSFNHYAYGCVGDWLFRHVAGLGDDPRGVSGGFADLLLRPGPMPLMRQLHARFASASGVVESGWRAEPGGLLFTFAVPEGVSAHVVLPVHGAWDGMTVNGTFLMGLSEELPVTRLANGSCSLDLPPGRWTFTAPTSAAAPLLEAWDDL